MELNHSISSVSSISTADHTAGHDLSGFPHTAMTSGLNDSRELDALCFALNDVSTTWVHVTGLETRISSDTLRSLFYQHGANEAFATAAEDSTGRRMGFVSFLDPSFAELAVEKMNGFVPMRQRGPLTVELVTPQTIRKLYLHSNTSGSLPHATPSSPDKINSSRLFSHTHSDDDVSDSPHVIHAAIADHSGSNRQELHSYPYPIHIAQQTSRRPTRGASHYPHNNPLSVSVQSCNTTSSAIAVVMHEISTVVSEEAHSRLQRVASGLLAVSPHWPLLREFKASLFRRLLEDVVHQATSDAFTALRCGTLIGLLFSVHFVEGDPYDLARRLLKEAVQTELQAEAVLALVQECRGMVFPRSLAAFHAALADAAVMHFSIDVRRFCVQAIKELATATASSLDDASNTSSLSSNKLQQQHPHQQQHVPSELTKVRCEEVKSRTVHISRVPAGTSRKAFVSFLTSCGTVDKVRVCLEGGSHNVFCFVEMATVEGTQALLRHDGAVVRDSAIRVRMARAPIQDVHPHDAIMGPHSMRLRPCTFAQEGGVMLDGPIPTS